MKSTIYYYIEMIRKVGGVYINRYVLFPKIFMELFFQNLKFFVIHEIDAVKQVFELKLTVIPLKSVPSTVMHLNRECPV